ncbi:hypothetical protein RHSIM_Rhsim08G0133500 [Rhododendron simsii]|uniref:Putative plant transposon protein domain-containing protein n=1 Tax=Rhododendron simsii TaxID=118357 RepID=A0A834GIQ0_RHOSS|nr:hypothetical protein RHSIM_Rhsim08G0133500 [Rhododendron simsii]
MSTTTKLSKDTDGVSVDQTLYRSMIGSLLYLIASCPDIAFSVGVCARYQANPKESHLTAIKCVIKYVSGTIGYGIWLSRDTTANLAGYSDADWAGCADDRKSTSGGCFYIGNNLEFFNNIYSYDKNSECLFSWVRGFDVEVSPSILGSLVGLAPLDEYVNPFKTVHRRFNLTTKQDISIDLTGRQGLLTRDFRLLNLFFYHNVDPNSHSSEISPSHGFALQAISKNQKVDWCRVAFMSIAKFGYRNTNISSVLPFGILISRLLLNNHVPEYIGDDDRVPSLSISPFIDSHIDVLSSAHVSANGAGVVEVTDDESHRGRNLDPNFVNLRGQLAAIVATSRRLEEIVTHMETRQIAMQAEHRAFYHADNLRHTAAQLHEGEVGEFIRYTRLFFNKHPDFHPLPPR